MKLVIYDENYDKIRTYACVEHVNFLGNRIIFKEIGDKYDIELTYKYDYCFAHVYDN